MRAPLLPTSKDMVHSQGGIFLFDMDFLALIFKPCITLDYYLKIKAL